MQSISQQHNPTPRDKCPPAKGQTCPQETFLPSTLQKAAHKGPSANKIITRHLIKTKTSNNNE